MDNQNLVGQLVTACSKEFFFCARRQFLQAVLAKFRTHCCHTKDQIDQAMNDIEPCDRPRARIFHVTCTLHMHGYELLMAP